MVLTLYYIYLFDPVCASSFFVLAVSNCHAIVLPSNGQVGQPVTQLWIPDENRKHREHPLFLVARMLLVAMPGATNQRKFNSLVCKTSVLRTFNSCSIHHSSYTTHHPVSSSFKSSSSS